MLFLASTFPLSIIRFGALFGVIFIGSISYLINHHKHHKITDEEEQKMIDRYYEKDQNGIYPWEKDTDQSPERITPDAKRHIINNKPRRGKW